MSERIDFIKRLGGEELLDALDEGWLKAGCDNAFNLLSDGKPHTSAEIRAANHGKKDGTRRARELRTYGFELRVTRDSETREYIYQLTGFKEKKKQPSYSEYIQSPEWAGTRSRRFDINRVRHGGQCENIGCHNRATDCHHLTYCNLGHEEMNDLACLCSVCHRAVHDFEVKGGYPKPQSTARSRQNDL